MPLSKVNSNSIKDGTVVAADILDGTISSSKLVAANISSDRLLANTLSNSVFQTGSVENYLNASINTATGDCTLEQLKLLLITLFLNDKWTLIIIFPLLILMAGIIPITYSYFCYKNLKRQSSIKP